MLKRTFSLLLLGALATACTGSSSNTKLNTYMEFSEIPEHFAVGDTLGEFTISSIDLESNKPGMLLKGSATISGFYTNKAKSEVQLAGLENYDPCIIVDSKTSKGLPGFFLEQKEPQAKFGVSFSVFNGTKHLGICFDPSITNHTLPKDSVGLATVEIEDILFSFSPLSGLSPYTAKKATVVEHEVTKQVFNAEEAFILAAEWAQKEYK